MFASWASCREPDEPAAVPGISPGQGSRSECESRIERRGRQERLKAAQSLKCGTIGARRARLGSGGGALMQAHQADALEVAFHGVGYSFLASSLPASLRRPFKSLLVALNLT